MPFALHLEQYDRRIALLEEGREPMSYAALAAAADNLRSGIDERGLAFLVCDNRTESVIGYIALLRAGVPTALLLEDTSPERLNRLIEAYQPCYLYLPGVAAEGVRDAAPCGSCGDYVLLRTRAGGRYAIDADLALLLTTSGSTGSPKFVRLSATNVDSNARAIAESLEIRDRDRAITTLPMHYSYGLSILNSHLAAGASVALTKASLMERRFWSFFESSEASTFGGVPQTYRMLKKLRFEDMTLPSLRYVTQAGGKLEAAISVEFAENCERRGRKFITMYGQTEATARMACLPWTMSRTKAGSIGRAIPGGELWLEDEDGVRIEHVGEAGELTYRGPNVALGYAESRNDLANGDQFHGVLRTGDIAVRDADGIYSVVGRRSRFIKVFGSRVSLDELEQIVRATGVECACTGTDDRLTIHVVGEGHSAAVLQSVTATTGIHRSAVSVHEVAQLPLNESGKVKYAALA